MKKLWDTKAFSSGENDSRKGRAVALFSSHLLTILLALFLLIVVSILAIVLWTSNGGSNQKEAEQAFYDPSKPQVVDTSTGSSSLVPDMSSSSVAEETPVTEETTPSTEDIQVNGVTVVVMAGEGAGQIAARAGISVDQLYALNPDKLVGPGGTWWANPGDVVYVD